MAVGFKRERGGEGGLGFRHESGRQQASSGALFRHALFRQRQADVAVDHGRFLVYRRVAAAGPRGAEDGRLDSGDRCGRWRALLALFCYGLDIGHPSSGNVVLGGPGRLRARPEQGCKPGQVSRFLSRGSMREHVRRRGVLRAALRSGLARPGDPPSRRNRATKRARPADAAVVLTLIYASLEPSIFLSERRGT